MLLEDFLGFKNANSSSAFFLCSSLEELSLEELLLSLALLFSLELLFLLDLCSELSTSDASLLTLLRDCESLSLSLDEEDSEEDDLFFLFFKCFLDFE